MKIFLLSFLAILSGCTSGTVKIKNTAKEIIQDSQATSSPKAVADPARILSKKQVPVLCYHHIKNFEGAESANLKDYTVTPAAFAAQMKALNDSGFQTILPGELYEYLVHDAILPPKPVMISFDDTDEEQYSIGSIEMNKYGFKGVYFIMTVAMNRPRYMSKAQIKNLSDSGHVIAGHTWDHHMVTKYAEEDWNTQLVKPQIQLQAITGKPVKYFAYPFGLWNKVAIPEVKNRGYELAFILSAKRDSLNPLYTIRRMIVPGKWSANGMLSAMNATFDL